MDDDESAIGDDDDGREKVSMRVDTRKLVGMLPKRRQVVDQPARGDSSADSSSDEETDYEKPAWVECLPSVMTMLTLASNSLQRKEDSLWDQASSSNHDH
jgi:hypothetical protein